MDIELRWIVPPTTTTKPAVLQYRTAEVAPHWNAWRDVPTVVLPATPKPGESKEVKDEVLI